MGAFLQMPCGIFYQFLGPFFGKKFLAKNCLAGKAGGSKTEHPSVQKGVTKVRPHFSKTPFCTEGSYEGTAAFLQNSLLYRRQL